MTQLRQADYSRLLSLARRYAFAGTEAEDLLQEAVVIALRQAAA